MGGHESHRLPFLPSDAIIPTLKSERTIVSATVSSLISTFAGYPLDSLKSRLQARRTPITVFRLGIGIWREEGVAGFFRGIWIPLFTISAVRAASFTIYTGTKEALQKAHWLDNRRLTHVVLAGWFGGAISGSVRRQLEFSIAEKRGVVLHKAPSTAASVLDIVHQSGVRGLYTGFHLHLLRDTLGTAMYFAEYDCFRRILGRLPSGAQGPQPAWLPFHLPDSLLPFLCGSFAGVSSWAIIYPLDVVKTKVQQRALSGEQYRSALETFTRLVRGTDPDKPKPIYLGLARLYRGLGVSASRSIITHGVLWTMFDKVGVLIDSL
ncbi:mitochondrial carrier [Cantharellus anzutake]|uniref:mitochondrial carrier n=1 Tax=Cantharellus anzutake TaxID=1750568 RepID=UPI0019035AD5|nr:mitochondrial carrier [Cantharellus anzutake]KAF8310049.1 mitochondrial carrier [Cantharellus anzutake]